MGHLEPRGAHACQWRRLRLAEAVETRDWAIDGYVGYAAVCQEHGRRHLDLGQCGRRTGWGLDLK